ncbi:bifunctional biotin--[acetyl-CoA-carboxylase] ligase/biotin operon repressor BirA [Streptococcus oralis]|uniref:Bifunctional ligase/repressor BirA n=1 Tax=Streptococcus oralis subsp. oralis TaxID=1891914 RepID=A0ABD6RM69_STROR|nr:bifunctional biotin--[acetyl-CoA-carboxylase] ligase/biotin operon repressor BirA [Streptococcus oralis]MBK3298741.1 bifunctional biotin--[acetyl-CoA-carboxylase] ligase/biotin operon repressor BirA [Streptococcus oralis]MBS9397394.1 bifunctional biotin--[acetyl-CoA-carboxylase] ligase/biotin operon repressor BirA [Streptococcus oralis]ORO74300.1 biotin--[acetyl-CoA-carboxylase] ligase [Streptococcus oralis subsp. oralis]
MKSHQLVYQILARENDYVSGEKIGEELNLSRTSIWKAIQRLQQEGLEIDSIKNRGYKLIQGDLILPDLIQENTNLTIRYKPETKSTQTDAKEGIEAGNKGNTLYLSTCQTAGRGRFQRPYYSPSQGGIYMSLHIQPNLPYEKLPSYTLLVAAAVYKAIKNLTMIEVDIKWVNDIYLKNKKIAGILTEAMTSVETDLVTDVIIGLGINFSIADFPDNLKEKAGSLFTAPAPISRNDLISEIWNCFYNTDPDELLYIYKERSIVLGKEVTFQLDGKVKKGFAKEISESGQLQVEFEDKHTIWLNSGEISLTNW